MPTARYPVQINAIPESAMGGLSNLKDAFGLSNDKVAFCAAFAVSDASPGQHENVLLSKSTFS